MIKLALCSPCVCLLLRRQKQNAFPFCDFTDPFLLQKKALNRKEKRIDRPRAVSCPFFLVEVEQARLARLLLASNLPFFRERKRSRQSPSNGTVVPLSCAGGHGVAGPSPVGCTAPLRPHLLDHFMPAAGELLPVLPGSGTHRVHPEQRVLTLGPSGYLKVQRPRRVTAPRPAPAPRLRGRCSAQAGAAPLAGWPQRT